MSDRHFGLILPDNWWRIPLVNVEARDKAIMRMIDSQIPRRDDLARIRHEFKDEIRQQCEHSAKLGGIVTAMMFQKIDDVTLRANMTCYDVSQWLPLPPGVDQIRILARWVGDKDLEDSRPEMDIQVPPRTDDDEKISIDIPENLPEAESSESPLDEAPWVKVEDFDVLAYRRDIVAPASDYYGEAGTKYEQLRVSYISAVPDFGLVQSAFATPFPQGRTDWLKLFDAIVASYRVPGSTPTSNTMKD